MMYVVRGRRSKGKAVCPSCHQQYQKEERHQPLCLGCLEAHALGQDLIYCSEQSEYNEANLINLINCYTNYKVR